MNRFRKALCVALVLLLLVASVPAVPVADLGFGITASALNATGKCGKTATYTFDSATGKLTIEGTGKINAEAFYSNDDIKEVVIGDGITEIGADAFNDCNNLTTVELGKTVTVIGDKAFYDCYYLTGVDIPDSVITIGDSAFYGCYKLTSVEIPDSVTTIGDWTFGNCNNLTSVVIGNGVKTIGTHAFESCDNLASVTVGNSVESISYSAFKNCTSLESINIPKTVTSIGSEAFRYCPSLYDVYYEGSEEEWNAISIGANNTALENATIHFGSVSEPSTGCAHNTGEHTVIQRFEPTCTEDGHYRYFQCKCGVYFFRLDASNNQLTEVIEDPTTFGVIPALGHDFIEDKCSRCGDYDVCKHDKANTLYVAGKNPTCTEDGFKSYYICQCGAKVQYPSLDNPKVLNDEELIVSALGHDFTDATCIEAKKCKREGCTATEGTPVPHNVDGVEFTKYDDVYHSKKCNICGADIALAKHSFGDFVVTTQPTCTEKGEKTSTCVCGATKISEVAAVGHRWQSGWCKYCGEGCEHNWSGNECKICGYTCVNHVYDDANCQYEAICYICGNKVADKNPNNHVTAETYIKNQKEAKCYEPGYTGDEYYYCCDGLKKAGKEITVDHVYATTLSKKDNATHGKKCTNEGCSAFEASSVAEHNYKLYTIIRSATCVENGEAIFKCDDCGAVKTDEIAKLDHEYSAIVSKKDDNTHGKRCYVCNEYTELAAHAYTETVSKTLPTCVTAGSETKKCVCGDEKTEMLPVNDNHDWGAWTETLAPTCTTAGSKARCCKRVGCTAKDVVAIEATGHDLVKVPAVAATCQNAGNNEYYDCTKCNMVFKDAAATTATTVVAETIAKGEHNFTYYVYNVNSESCTKEGTETAKCGNCDATHTRDKVGTMVAHLFKNYVSDGNATCFADGTKSAVCEMCKEAKDTVADKDSHKVAPHKPDSTGRKCELCGAELVCTHTYSVEKIITKTPTCTTDGEKAIVCSKCHANKPGSEEVVPATGHDWSEGEITKMPTCKNTGSMRYTCDNMCGETKTEEIPALGHDYINNICTRCGAVNGNPTPDTGDHTYPDQWSVIIPATCKETGVAIKICFDCNEVITMIVPKTGHKDINRDDKCDMCEKTIGVVDNDEPDIPEKPEEKPCNCDCHAGGIKAFFFKLINFFVKIFDKNARVCDCGKAH